jgi:hypothetical protein
MAPEDDGKTCGKPATTSRVIENVEFPLCEEHADEIDADFAAPARRP